MSVAQILAYEWPPIEEIFTCFRSLVQFGKASCNKITELEELHLDALFSRFANLFGDGDSVKYIWLQSLTICS